MRWDIARWWPLPFAAVFFYAPLDLDSLGRIHASTYYGPVFYPTAIAAVALAVWPRNNLIRHVAVVLTVGVCVSRALAILSGTDPIAGLAGLVWMLIAYAFCMGSVMSWMELEKRGA